MNNAFIIFYKFVPNIALDILILKNYSLFILNSNLIGHPIFLLLNLETLVPENFNFTMDIDLKGLKGRESIKKEDHKIWGEI